MWFFYAFLSALASAASLVSRRTRGALAKPAELAWGSLLLGMIPTTILLLMSRENHWSSSAFILPALAASVMNGYSGVLGFRALKYSEMSVVSPLSNLVPVGLLVSSFIMFGTKPSGVAVLAIGLIAFGLYYSGISKQHGLLTPIKAIWRQRGARAMLGCVLIWSISTNLQQIALQSTSPAFLLFFSNAVSLILLSMYVAVEKNHKPLRVMKKFWPHLAGVGFFTTLSVYFQMLAMRLTDTSYVLAIKRLDVLMVVLFAGIFLHERHLLKRLDGSALALAGVALLYFSR